MRALEGVSLLRSLFLRWFAEVGIELLLAVTSLIASCLSFLTACREKNGCTSGRAATRMEVDTEHRDESPTNEVLYCRKPTSVTDQPAARSFSS